MTTPEQANIMFIAARAETVRKWMTTDMDVTRNLHGLQRALDAQIGDVDYLIAELHKREEAIARVEALAAQWTKRGEHDMAFSKTIQDEDIAIAILTNGADMVENARHIRNALAAP